MSLRTEGPDATETAALLAELDEVHVNLDDDDQAAVVLRAIVMLRRYARGTATEPPGHTGGCQE